MSWTEGSGRKKEWNYSHPRATGKDTGKGINCDERCDGNADSDRGKDKNKQAEYVLALKGNQGTLHEDVKTYLEDKEFLKEIQRMGVTKNAGKGTWSDRDKGVLSNRRYPVANSEERVERLKKYPCGKKNAGKSGEKNCGIPIFHKQHERGY